MMFNIKKNIMPNNKYVYDLIKKSGYLEGLYFIFVDDETDKSHCSINLNDADWKNRVHLNEDNNISINISGMNYKDDQILIENVNPKYFI